MNERPDKRSLDTRDHQGSLPEERRKRPSFQTNYVDEPQLNNQNTFLSSLEPLIRRVVADEVEKVLKRLIPQGISLSSRRPPASDNVLAVTNDKKFRLQFRSKLALPLFTGSKVEAENGSVIHVIIQDSTTGQLVANGPESCLKLEVVVLEGDFSLDDEKDWSREEFDQNVVRERDGKRPLLSGDQIAILKDGVATLGELTFTDNSSWIRSRKFRLGIRVAPGQPDIGRVREAKTEAFTVKDHRGELYKKHYPPALNDEVWRLDRIGKDGAFHKRLNQAGIFTVEDFLRLVVMDPQKLRNILGSGMSNKMWEGTVEHAKTCVLNGKLHVYYADDKQNIGVIFNNIFQLMGLIADGQYMSVDLLSESEKIYVDKLVKVAYENWENVVEYDGEALIGMKSFNSLQGINAATEEPMLQIGNAPYRLSTQQQQQQQHYQPDSTGVGRRQSQHPAPFSRPNGLPPANESPSNSGQYLGWNGGMAQATPSRESGGAADFEPIRQSTLSKGDSARISLSDSKEDEGPPGGHGDEGSRLVIGAAGWNSLFGPDLDENIFSEEELRAKSAEMLLENDELRSQVQQLIGFLDPTNSGNIVIPDEFDLTKLSPNLPAAASKSGRASVNWLKLKAALQWSIHIRNVAAEKRKQATWEQMQMEAQGSDNSDNNH